MAEIQSVLKPLEHFETLMQEIYAKLAQRFGSDPDAGALFRRLAFEERSHVGQVQFLRRIARQNPSHFSEVDVDSRRSGGRSSRSRGSTGPSISSRCAKP
jgi:rubrerythrin